MGGEEVCVVGGSEGGHFVVFGVEGGDWLKKGGCAA